MTYRIEILPAAERELERLDRPVRERVDAKIRELSENPRPPGVKILKGWRGAHRVRIADWRIVYLIEDERLLVLVIRVRHRKEAYR